MARGVFLGRQGVLGWHEAAEAGAPRCGGKGWNLGRLHRYGFPVPAGGVLPADAYLHFLTDPALARLQTSLADVSAADAADAEVGRRLDEVQAAIRAREIPSEIADAVRAFLADSGLGGTPLAVRSSATAEDGAAASFAGIHRSFLNVTGPDEVLNAVKGCYASLWTPAALAYRRRLNLADREVACAVVLCAMVGGPGGAPASAGVAFSCDPRTGRRDLILVNAIRGLGDALVSGHVRPEEIAVRQAHARLRPEGRGGWGAGVLTDRQAVELARLVLRVHWALGDGQEPQDVEWAHDGERFWLLQARPVTRVPHTTFPGVRDLPVIWSNANLKEVVPGVPTTMTWSVLQPALWEILYAAPEAAGYPVPGGMVMVRRFSGRLYFDVTALQWVFYDCFGAPPSDSNRGLGGHQPAIPVPAGGPYAGRRGRERLMWNWKMLRVCLSVRRKLPRVFAGAHAVARRAGAVDLSALSDKQLLDRMVELGLGSVPLAYQAQLGTAAAGLWQGVLLQVLRRVAPGRETALGAGLMAGSGGVTTAAQGYRLFELAAEARRDPEALEYLAREPLDPAGWRRLPAGNRFRSALERFLADFGHRCVYEVEIGNPRWNEDPTFLLEQVRALLATGPVAPPEDAARARRAEAEAELARRTLFLRPLVQWLARRAREGAAFREAGKSATMALWEPVRAQHLEAGRRLVAAGALDDPADVFHLAWADVESFLCGEWDGRGARTLAADRRARDAAWRAGPDPPDVMILDAEGRPAELPAGAAPAPTPPAPPEGGPVLAGNGVAAGRASGPARVLRHPDEGRRLQPGDVLVAPTTDPGWTPLFLRAAALVMEVGGYLSHGAIVAREYGIPAVANVPGLLGRVRDGQRLTVDGDAGRVTLG